MKKKLSVLIAAALCVTVGGVYATWQYAEKNAESAKAELLIGITSVESATEKGSISITKDGVTCSIDHLKTGDSTEDAKYKATLLWATNGAGVVPMVVKFTPALNAQIEGIKLQCKITETYDSYDHDNNAETEKIDLFSVGTAWTANQTEYTFELNEGNLVGVSGCNLDLSKYLHLNPELTVPNSTLHTSLSNFLKESGKSIVIEVSEYTGA